MGQVEPGGAAERAGLKPGDLILKIDQTAILHSEELPRVVANHPPGSKVKVEVLRDKVTRVFDVTLDSLKEEEETQNAPQAPGRGGPATPSSLGLSLADVPGQGVVVRQIAPNSPAEGTLMPGDVMVEVNRQPVQGAAQAARMLAMVPSGRPILFKVLREGQPTYVAIERR